MSAMADLLCRVSSICVLNSASLKLPKLAEFIKSTIHVLSHKGQQTPLDKNTIKLEGIHEDLRLVIS